MHSIPNAATAIFVGLALWACAPAVNAPSGDRAPNPLLPSLQVSTGGELVRLVFQVTNVTDGAIELTFATGQSADFEVRRGEEVVWRWSEDQQFTQAIRREVLAAGESRSFSAEWRPAEPLRGAFTAVGWLAATGLRVDQAVQFSLP